MQWGQIKNIFIISFLVLNIFLVEQLFEKINQTNLDSLPHSTLEDQLKAEEIQIDQLPEAGQKEAYVSAKQYQFTDEDIEMLNQKLDQQSIAVINQETVVGEFIEPIDINLESEQEQSITKIKEQILYGDRYVYWKHYADQNVLIFFQQQNEHMIYYNKFGVVMVLLNDDGDAVRYRQTMLEEVARESDDQSVIAPMDAIRVMFNNDVLRYQDHVTNMNMGYHTLVQLNEGVQVFVPTWVVTVNQDDSYFVNAMEGQMIPDNEEEFITDLKTNLQTEIEEINRSETE